MGSLALPGLSGLSFFARPIPIRLNSVSYSVSVSYSAEPGLQPTFLNLNDGSFSTGCATTSAATSWILADTGLDQLIHKIRLSSGVLPGGWGGVRAYLEGAIIQGAKAASPDTFEFLDTVVGLPFDSDSVRFKDFFLNSTYRYIRLQMSNNYLATAEFSIYTC